MNQWRKPNSEEAARGFVAICLVWETVRKYNKEQFVGRVPYLRHYFYTEAMLIRRASWSKDLPPFWKPQEQEDKDAAWLHYIETGVASEEVQETLETLGSYKQEIAA